MTSDMCMVFMCATTCDRSWHRHGHHLGPGVYLLQHDHRLHALLLLRVAGVRGSVARLQAWLEGEIRLCRSEIVMWYVRRVMSCGMCCRVALLCWYVHGVASSCITYVAPIRSTCIVLAHYMYDLRRVLHIQLYFSFHAKCTVAVITFGQKIVYWRVANVHKKQVYDFIF